MPAVQPTAHPGAQQEVHWENPHLRPSQRHLVRFRVGPQTGHAEVQRVVRQTENRHHDALPQVEHVEITEQLAPP